jgi:hypothetical protein
MEADYILKVAETARRQLLATTDLDIVMSWGIERMVGMTYKDMPALKFTVHGRLFEGSVIIAYNALDHYEVYLVNDEEHSCIGKEVYFDMIGDLIDEKVERGTDPEEYARFIIDKYKDYPGFAIFGIPE